MSIAQYQLDSGIHAFRIIADQGKAHLRRRCILPAWLPVPTSFLQLALPPVELALTEFVLLTIAAHRHTAARCLSYRLPPVLLLLGVRSSSSHSAPPASATTQTDVRDMDVAHISVTVAEYQGMLPAREDGFTGRIRIDCLEDRTCFWLDISRSPRNRFLQRYARMRSISRRKGPACLSEMRSPKVAMQRASKGVAFETRDPL